MNKTASQIADEVLEKVAVRKATKVLLDMMEKNLGRKVSVTELKNSPLGDLNTLVGGSNFRWLPSNEKTRINEVVRAAIGEGRRKNTNLTFSGAHKIRPDEVGIPATLNAQEIANPGRPRSPFLFRGNPIPKSPRYADAPPQPGAGPPAYTTTRHPEVAAAAALQGIHNPASRRVLVYPRKGSKAIETYEYGYGKHWDNPGSLLRNTGDARKYNLSSETFTGEPLSLTSPKSVLNPQYEAVTPWGYRPEALGEFSVRRARGPKGDPLYALRRVSGEGPERFFDASGNVR